MSSTAELQSDGQSASYRETDPDHNYRGHILCRDWGSVLVFGSFAYQIPNIMETHVTMGRISVKPGPDYLSLTNPQIVVRNGEHCPIRASGISPEGPTPSTPFADGIGSHMYIYSNENDPLTLIPLLYFSIPVCCHRARLHGIRYHIARAACSTIFCASTAPPHTSIHAR